MKNRKLQRLPESELDIMLALWQGEGDMTRSEIEKIVNQKKNLAATTILTLLKRLENKHYVSVRKEGKQNWYRSLVSREEYQRQEGKGILEKLYGNSLKTFVSALYDGRQIGEEDLEDLEEFLKDLSRENKG